MIVAIISLVALVVVLAVMWHMARCLDGFDSVTTNYRNRRKP